jgi:hypothetical protein
MSAVCIKPHFLSEEPIPDYSLSKKSQYKPSSNFLPIPSQPQGQCRTSKGGFIGKTGRVPFMDGPLTVGNGRVL